MYQGPDTKQKQRPFWLAQALAQEGAVPVSPVMGCTTADVCIVGGGFTGLWTAIQLKQQSPELDVVLLEADICGAGASGRNGGCVLSWATKYLTLEKLFGESEAMRLVRASELAIEQIGAFVRAHRIACDFRHDGVLYTAMARAHAGSTDAVIAALSSRGINSYASQSPEEVARRSGSACNISGVFSPQGASVQPGKLVRGMRRVALQMGVRLHEHSSMQRLDPATMPIVHTDQGQVQAKKVVLALNAWMPQQYPEFSRSIIVVSSDMVVTQARPDLLARTGLTNGLAVLDSRTFVYYYHSTSDGRIMLGKGGNTFSYGARMLPVFDQPSPYRVAMGAALGEFFPPYAELPLEASWNGPSDRATTGLPFFGTLRGHPSVFYGLGYSGNGVGPSYMGGQILSSLVLEQDNVWTRSGLAKGPRGKFPIEPFRYLGSLLVRNAIRRKEHAEMQGKIPCRIDKALSHLADAAGKADHG